MFPSRSIPRGPAPAGWRLLLPGLLLLALAGPVTAVAADWPRQLAYREPGPAGVRATGGLNLSVDAERTVLDRDGLVLTIDYHLLQVIRQPAGRTDRVVYPLARPGQRTAAPLTVAWCGETFGERRVRYLVSDTVPGYDALARLAATRRPVIRANPLLLQLDPVNLILPLGGLPVRLEEGDNDQGRVLELQP